jgi:hypothetical protein
VELNTRDLLQRMDDLRVAAAAVTPVLEQLEALCVDRKARAKTLRLLGLTEVVGAWCWKQRQLLADGDDRQQQILLELLALSTEQEAAARPLRIDASPLALGIDELEP